MEFQSFFIKWGDSFRTNTEKNTPQKDDDDDLMAPFVLMSACLNRSFSCTGLKVEHSEYKMTHFSEPLFSVFTGLSQLKILGYM